MQYEIVSNGKIKKAMYLDQIHQINIRKSPTIEWVVMKPRIVMINGIEWLDLQYNPADGKFFSDENNREKTLEQVEWHKIEAKKMEEDGKTEAEIKEYFAWKWTIFIDQVEYIIESNVNVTTIVNNLISKMTE